MSLGFTDVTKTVPVGTIFPTVSELLAELLAMFGLKLLEMVLCLGLRNGAVKVEDLGMCEMCMRKEVG